MFQRILLALDAGDAGEVATSFTIALARTCGASVYVVHVNRYLFGGRGLAHETPAEAANVVAESLREMHDAGVGAAGVTYRTTAFDLPAAICDLAQQCHADAIVMGSRRRRFGAFLRRGVRDRVARRTALPVLTAPAPLCVDGHDRTFREMPTIFDLPVGSESQRSER